jgi:hypothetical protein
MQFELRNTVRQVLEAQELQGYVESIGKKLIGNTCVVRLPDGTKAEAVVGSVDGTIVAPGHGQILVVAVVEVPLNTIHIRATVTEDSAVSS